MEVRPQPATTKGPDTWFTGDVWIDGITGGDSPPNARVSTVRFTPGARTAWHSHASGQTLYVTDGQGLTQARGGELARIRAGDVVTTPAGEWHWHGAAPDHYMSHITITERVAAPGSPETDWGAHVTDAEYRGA